MRWWLWQKIYIAYWMHSRWRLAFRRDGSIVDSSCLRWRRIQIVRYSNVKMTTIAPSQLTLSILKNESVTSGGLVDSNGRKRHQSTCRDETLPLNTAEMRCRRTISCWWDRSGLLGIQMNKIFRSTLKMRELTLNEYTWELLYWVIWMKTIAVQTSLTGMESEEYAILLELLSESIWIEKFES